MSGICGVVRLDGAPADPDLLERMIARVAWRGPEGAGRWREGPAALGFTRLATTPEAVDEVQPLVDGESGLVLLLDGRVDYREELAALLARHGRSPRDPSDAALVLAAHSVWGRDCPERIEGDWAFAVWDPGAGTLFAARDALGLRPFFWWEEGGRLVFGSDPRLPFEDPSVPCRPNEAYLGERLAGFPRTWDETRFAGVRVLPPGHTLVAGPTGTTVRRWWTPRPVEEAARLSLPAAAERFRELVDGAVRTRLRARGRVGVLLSGGVDSGAVAHAAGLLSGGGGRVLALTHVHPGEPFDEGERARATAGDAGLEFRGVPYRDPPAGAYAAWARETGGVPTSPLGLHFRGALEACAGEGVRVLLSGHGGDEWPGGSATALGEALAAGRLGTFLRLVATGVRHGGPGAGVAALREGGLQRALPGPLRRAGRALLPRRPPSWPWIEPAFVARVGLVERMTASYADPSVGEPRVEALLRSVVSGWWGGGWEEEDRLFAAAGTEERHPLMDLRLLRFCLGLPPEHAWDGRRTKVVLRESLRGRGDPALAAREEKPHGTPVVLRVLRDLDAGGHLRWRGLADGGIVVAGDLGRRLEAVRAWRGAEVDGVLGNLWPCWSAHLVDLVRGLH